MKYFDSKRRTTSLTGELPDGAESPDRDWQFTILVEGVKERVQSFAYENEQRFFPSLASINAIPD